jgi:hypothetical protein
MSAGASDSGTSWATSVPRRIDSCHGLERSCYGPTSSTFGCSGGRSARSLCAPPKQDILRSPQRSLSQGGDPPEPLAPAQPPEGSLYAFYSGRKASSIPRSTRRTGRPTQRHSPGNVALGGLLPGRPWASHPGRAAAVGRSSVIPFSLFGVVRSGRERRARRKSYGQRVDDHPEPGIRSLIARP